MNIPKHVAIIMDGNRRWAVEKGYPKIVGHTHGAKNLKRITLESVKQGISFLTLYALSTENVANRSESELKHLFSLFVKLIDYRDLFKDNDVVFRAIGNIKGLPEAVQQTVRTLEEETKDNKSLTLTVCVNYGGRDEIVRAARKIVKSGGEITEDAILSSLDFPELPDVDLVIRTGGHQRLSNFLTWQATYAELYFTDTKWPAFDEAELVKALEWFTEQKRNAGK
ncbi:di-trans,poly-cis-decaprenylcistransferase [Candidatus Uhrbacteria bacterium]|jgi:undecaprenyl diphosphate synthase|nr:di-trans,poly-cis-decaprenylcistransferase [Candidatus Uhrbacteria bacterium]